MFSTGRWCAQKPLMYSKVTAKYSQQRISGLIQKMPRFPVKNNTVRVSIVCYLQQKSCNLKYEF
jgi:hypothetical protein